jgi:hypothetical protein
MPIIDMFESQSSISEYYSSSPSHYSSVQSLSNAAIYGTYVLKIVNKLIHDGIRTQEQLSRMGIIPTVMNLFEKSFSRDC